MANCTVYLPGLLHSLRDTAVMPRSTALSALTVLLSRANRQPHTLVNVYNNALQWLGYTLCTDAELPGAALRAALPDSIPPGTYWCLDPVSLQLDRDRALLVPPGQVRLRMEQAQPLIATINTHFAAEGIQLHAHTPDQWLLHLTTPLSLRTTDLASASGRDVLTVLPQGADAQRWRSLRNEIEMLLYDHPVNQQREAEGEWPINSVWLWGGGVMPAVSVPSMRSVYSDDPLVHVAAQHLKLPVQVLPASLASIPWQDTAVGIFSLDNIEGPHLALLEQTWFKPLIDALRARQLSQVELITQGWRFILTPSLLRRWWRRPRPLSHWITLPAHE
ncbi:MAG: hypothetical protein HY080_02050 [Gammaproteobacteria bacterium]|nr:hypothetical protein [Gammaproteobacteria bacterium]